MDARVFEAAAVDPTHYMTRGAFNPMPDMTRGA
jgi:hypothetical protein